MNPNPHALRAAPSRIGPGASPMVADCPPPWRSAEDRPSLRPRPWHVLSPEDRSRVQDLSIDPRQAAHAGALERALASCELADPDEQTGLSLWLGDTPVGFLVLSRGALVPAWAPPGSAGISALRIDARFQGHGLGQTALRVAEAWLAQHWPACTQLVLSVDESNTVARRTCARAGFQPCQSPRPGRDGAVHDLCKRLGPAVPLDAG